MARDRETLHGRTPRNGHEPKMRDQNGWYEIRFPPTVRITRKGLALLHKRLGEIILNETLETITD